MTARIEKASTGIVGFDAITDGGLPRGRTTLVCGGPGCGKTLFAAEFLLRAARDLGEPAVLISFEETPEELADNLASLGHDVADLVERRLLVIDHVQVNRTATDESGAYSLDGLFARLAHAVDSIGARRVAFDTLEVLYAGLRDAEIIRSELRRLFHWLKERDLTGVVTAERGTVGLTRHGIEEYVSDCVVVLDHESDDRVATRRLQVMKYRGSAHGTGRYPFIITDDGLEVVPASRMRLDHPASTERHSSGVPALDEMLGGEGFHRGSTVLVSGQAGTGKSSLAMSFAIASALRGERSLYLSFEESAAQISRNMASLGMDVAGAVAGGALQINATQPTTMGLEVHLGHLTTQIERVAPQIVVIDAVNALEIAGSRLGVKLMLMRLVDLLKLRGVTTMLVSLLDSIDVDGDDDVGISSLVDTWLLLRNLEQGGERNRGLYVLKSRGTAHSNQIREFVLGSHGIELLAVEISNGEVLTGSARLSAESDVRAQTSAALIEADRVARTVTVRRQALDAHIALLEAEYDSETAQLTGDLAERRRQTAQARVDQTDIAERRS